MTKLNFRNIAETKNRVGNHFFLSVVKVTIYNPNLQIEYITQLFPYIATNLNSLQLLN